MMGDRAPPPMVAKGKGSCSTWVEVALSPSLAVFPPSGLWQVTSCL